MQLQRGYVKRALALPALALVAVVLLLTLSSCGGSGGGGGSGLTGPARNTTPVVVTVSQPGTQLLGTKEDKAFLDYSNAADGYICAMSNLPSTRVKVLVKIGGAEYQYTIDTAGAYITIPLSQGNGTYDVGIWENISGDQYAAITSGNIEVTLTDQNKPFLTPSQYVNFAAGDQATNFSAELASGSVADVDVLNKIYDWVSSNITYDTEKATTVASGYLPVNSRTLSEKKGICFDYAVLTVSMLRAQQVPAKLVIGYAGSAYHAWIEVYCVQSGKVYSYTFSGSQWERMDPTFDAASRGAQDLSAVIGNGNQYKPLYYY